MMNIENIGTITAVLQKHKQQVLDSINVQKIGKILSINENDTYDVVLLEKRQINDNTYPQLIIKNCPYAGNMGKKNGFKNILNIDDVVLLGFTDINYKMFFNGTSEIIDNAEDILNKKHDINNGIILSILSSESMPNEEMGIFLEDALIVIDKVSQKIALQNAQASLKDILSSCMSAINSTIDHIKTLQVIDPQTGSPLTFTNGSILDGDKSSFDDIITKINNLFLAK